MHLPARRSEAFPLETADEVDLDDLGYGLWRHRWLILAITALFTAIAGAVALLQRPVYESTAMLRIVPEEKGFDLGASSTSSMKLLLGLENTGDLQTAIGILESRRIAQEIVDSLALNVVLRAPAVPREDLLEVVDASGARSGRFELRRTSGGSYALSGRVDGERLSGSVVPGEVFRAGDVALRLRADAAAPLPDRVRVELAPYQKTVRRIQRRLSVSQPYGGSQLVRLRYRHADPRVAAAVPAIAASSFIAYKNHASSFEAHSILGFLREQAEVYQQDLRGAENQLQAFLEAAQVIEPKTQAEEQARRLAALQAEREALESERSTLAALLAQIEATPRLDTGPSPYRQLVAFPSFLTNSMVQNILHSIIALENTRAELLVQRLERDPDVRGKTERIQELEEQLHQVARNYLGDRERRLAAIDATLGRFATQVATLPAREVELRRLSREAELLEEVYQMIETKLKEEEIRAAAQLANVQVVDTPVVPDEPEFPKPWLYLLLGAAVGLVFGSGTAVLRNRGRPMVRNRDDVRAATAGLPVLAAIELPRAAHPKRNGNTALPAPAGIQRDVLRVGRVWPPRLLQRGELQGDGGGRLITGAGFDERLADAYRALRFNLTGLGEPGATRTLVVAGVDARDDARLTAANLAIAVAHLGSRVALVDGNLRAGLLHALFDVSAAPGLIDALDDEATLEGVIREVKLGDAGARLHLIPAGTSVRNPVDAVASVAMQRLIERLAELFDVVIIAAPAVNDSPEASVLARLADRTLLVATAGFTSRPALEAAARQLQFLSVPVEGVVLYGAS